MLKTGDRRYDSLKLFIFTQVILLMKTLGIILSIMLAAYTAQPLLGEMLHHNGVVECTSNEGCCDDHDDACCDIPSGHTHDDADHDCSNDCTCAMHGIVVFTTTLSPHIELFETILEKIEPGYVSYQYAFLQSIWHPPKA